MNEIRCPCCAQSLDLKPHQRKAEWSADQVQFIQRAFSHGVPDKVLAMVFETTPRAIQGLRIRGCHEQRQA